MLCFLRPIYTEQLPEVAKHDSLFVLLRPGVAVPSRARAQNTRRNKPNRIVRGFWQILSVHWPFIKVRRAKILKVRSTVFAQNFKATLTLPSMFGLQLRIYKCTITVVCSKYTHVISTECAAVQPMVKKRLVEKHL